MSMEIMAGAGSLQIIAGLDNQIPSGGYYDSLKTTLWKFHNGIKSVKSTIQVLQTAGPWADHYVSELAPVVQAPLLFFTTNYDAILLEALNVVAEQLEENIQVLGSFGSSWAEELIDCLRLFRTFIEDRIKVVLKVLGTTVFPHEILVTETRFFEYHGCGRPPRILDRALKAGLSQVKGRMVSSPALA